MKILSLADPSHPDSILCDTNIQAHDNAFYSNYIIAIGYHIRISDITNPYLPILISEFPVGSGPQHVYISGSYAYISSAHYVGHIYVPDINIVDIQNLQNPIVCSRRSEGEITDIFVQDSLAYLSCGYYGFSIYNVSNPYAPYLVSHYYSSIVACGIYVIGNYAYIGDQLRTLQIFDISDPINPRFVGACSTSFGTNNICVQGSYAFVAGGSNGICVIDITDPQNPHIVDHFNTPGLASDIAVANDYIYIADTYSLITLHSPYTSVLQEDNTPTSSFLSQSYPNPFNNITTIEYSIPEMANVTVEIFDVLGRKIDELVNQKEQPGYHKIVWNTSGRSSGIYFYKIKSGDYSESKKMLLLK